MPRGPVGKSGWWLVHTLLKPRPLETFPKYGNKQTDKHKQKIAWEDSGHSESWATRDKGFLVTYEKYRRGQALPGMAPSGWPVVGYLLPWEDSSYTHLSATIDLMSLVQPVWDIGLHAGRDEGIQDCSTQCSASFCSACLTPTVSPHRSLFCCLWPWLGTCHLINRSS